MTDEEKQQKLVEICPELTKGIDEGDVNSYIIKLIHEKVVTERQLQSLIQTAIALLEQNEELKNQLQRLSPLLAAQEDKK